MQNNSLELSFLSLIALISFFVFLIIQKFSHKISNGALLDDDFNKPQAFHSFPVSRCGGLSSFIVFLIFIFFYNSIFSNLYIEYLVICSGLFFIGFVEDLKINLSPKIRLFLMTVLLLFSVNFFSIDILKIELFFLNVLLQNKLFVILFISLCFLFIVNGANLIDGFNGLLGIHLIIINSILLYVNLSNNLIDISILIISQIIILLSFLLFNFPKPKMFMGDGGAYLFGSATALNVIITNNFNPLVSSFFFCTILFYLFFEVFFSFLRKVYQKKSPIKPDNLHLHMLLYNFLKTRLNLNDLNYVNSLFINFGYSLLVLPSIIFLNNGIICKYWFFSLLGIYLIVYARLYSFTKKKIDI